VTLTEQPNFQLQSINGDLRRGGYIVSVLASDTTNPVVYGQKVRLSGQSLAGGIQDAATTLVGDMYVFQTPPFQFDALTRNVTFQIATADQLLRQGGIQDIPYDQITPSTNPHQIVSPMRFSDILTEAITNHTNFVYDLTDNPHGIIFDFDFETTDTNISHYSLPKSRNFWGTITSKLGGGETGGVQFYRIWFTRRGVMKYQPAPPFISPALTSRADFDKSHIFGRPSVTIREPKDQISQVRLSSVGASPGVTFNSQFPTSTLGPGSPFEKTSGIWAETQAQTDDYAERVYRWLTRPYTVQIQVDEGLVLWGDDGAGIELGDMVTITYDGPVENAATGGAMYLDWDEEEFFVYGINIAYDNANQVGAATLTLEANN